MITFIVSLIVLLLGFTVYSRVAERVFGPDDRLTPGVRKADGIDFIVLPPWRIFLIQFLKSLQPEKLFLSKTEQRQ